MAFLLCFISMDFSLLSTGTVAYQTKVYGQYEHFPDGPVLVLSNKTIIPYGGIGNVVGTSLNNYLFPYQGYYSSS